MGQHGVLLLVYKTMDPVTHPHRKHCGSSMERSCQCGRGGDRAEWEWVRGGPRETIRELDGRNKDLPNVFSFVLKLGIVHLLNFLSVKVELSPFKAL